MQNDENIRRPGSLIAEKKELQQVAAKRAEAEALVNTLEQRVTALMGDCADLQKKGEYVQIQDFLKFQNLTSESLTFLVIIERRLDNLPRHDEGKLHDIFDDLVVAVWSIVMQGALSFLSTISNEEYLPLGSRELFIRELRMLHDAQRRLSERPYQNRISAEIRKEMQTAERILSEVIERAPSLLLF